MIHGLMIFPGIDKIVEGNFNLTTGITPSAASLTIAPQNHFACSAGTLTITDTERTIQFPGCRVAFNSFEYNQHGLVWKLTILDRRWKWSNYGGGNAVAGFRNMRDEHNEFLVSHDANGARIVKRSARDLAKDCLDAMGEENFDVNILPDDFYPLVQYDWINPAEALASLCDECGCMVVLGLDDKVRIRLIGEGNNLPIFPNVTMNSLDLDVPCLPNEIAIVCAPDRFQDDFELEAVGKDLPGKGSAIVPINQLSYMPVGGWTTDTIEFDNTGEQFGELAQVLAQATVFRMYRVKLPKFFKGLKGGGFISDIWKIHFEQEQVEQYEDADGKRCNNPAVVYGRCLDVDDLKLKNAWDLIGFTAEDETGRHLWRFDAKTGIVTFHAPIYRNTLADGTDTPNGLKIGPAILYLRTACTLLDETNYNPIRYKKIFDTGSRLDTQGRVETAEDLVLWHVPASVQSGIVGEINFDSTNQAQVDEECTKRYHAILHEYNAKIPQTVHYGGIVPIEPDGAIHHVHWMVGPSGTFTIAARNMELIRQVRSRNERRLTEKLKHHEFASWRKEKAQMHRVHPSFIR